MAVQTPRGFVATAVCSARRLAAAASAPRRLCQRDRTRVSLQLQYGFSIGIAAVSHDSPKTASRQRIGWSPGPGRAPLVLSRALCCLGVNEHTTQRTRRCTTRRTHNTTHTPTRIHKHTRTHNTAHTPTQIHKHTRTHNPHPHMQQSTRTISHCLSLWRHCLCVCVFTGRTVPDEAAGLDDLRQRSVHPRVKEPLGAPVVREASHKVLPQKE